MLLSLARSSHPELSSAPRSPLLLAPLCFLSLPSASSRAPLFQSAALQ